MDPPKLDAGSFEFYEGIRILIPGAAVVVAYAAIIGTFAIHAPRPTADALGAIAASIGAGLVLYFLDAPAKARSYSGDLPHATLDLQKLGIKLPPGVSRLNFYFILLDEIVPAPIRARALYMGSMYRIGFELIYVCFVTSTGVFAAALAGVAQPERSSGRSYIVFAVAGVLMVLLVPVALYLGYQRRVGRGSRGVSDHATTRADARTCVRADMLQQIPILDRLLLVAAVCLVALFCVLGGRPGVLYGVGAGLASALWVARYFRGARKTPPSIGWRQPIARLRQYVAATGHDRDRVSLAPPAAATYYSLASLMPFVSEFVLRPAHSVLSPGIASSWSAVNLVGGLLLVARGHERRLGGSYATQRAWFALNDATLRKRYAETSRADRLSVAAEDADASP